MISVEDIRTTITSTVSTLHTTSYPAIPINYPNRFTVDLETFSGTFFVTISFGGSGSIDPAEITGTDACIEGTITISTIFKTNTGLNGTTNYTSMLISNLLFKKISGVSYLDMKSIEISPYPGFKGVANIIRYKVI